MSDRKGHYLLLIAISTAVLFTNLGVPKLWDRDEPRNAGCAAEMLERQDWVVPVFNAELRTHKPILLYWMMMVSYSLLGVNEFAARLPSAVLGIGTVLATYELGRRLFRPAIGVWAGLVLVTTLMFDVAARAATPDAVLIFLGAMALLTYVRAAFPAPGMRGGEHQAVFYFPRRWIAAALMYAWMGLAVLAKGPVGLVLPTAVIGMFLLIMRLPTCDAAPSGLLHGARQFARPLAPRHFLRTCWSMRPVTAVVVALAVALPWYVWVGFRTDGAWIRGFFLEHNLRRALHPMEGHGGSGLFYYPVAIWVGCFPWSILGVPIGIQLLRGLRRKDGDFAAYAFLACWVGVYVGLFSLAQTKLPSYVTPCYPALALLCGCFIHRWSAATQPNTGWMRTGLVTLCLVGIALVAGLAVAGHEFLPGMEWLGWVGVIPIAGALGCLWALFRAEYEWVVRGLVATATVFSLAMFSVGAVAVSTHQQCEHLVDRFAGLGVPVVAFGDLEPSWVFYARQPITYFTFQQAEAAADFLNAHPESFVIATPQNLDRLPASVTDEMAVLRMVPYFLRDEQLQVCRRTPNLARHRDQGQEARWE